MKSLAAMLVLVWSLSASAADFVSIQLSSDHQNLMLRNAEGEVFAAPRLSEQAEFMEPHISPNGKYVGWLVAFDNCCTSYPVARLLVVVDQARHLHTYAGREIAFFDWCFLPDSKAVAYRQGVLHGSEFQRFERRRIGDGHLEADYEYPHDQAENARARRRAPTWVRCVPE